MAGRERWCRRGSGADAGAATEQTRARQWGGRNSGASGRREAIQVPVVCIGPAEQPRTMKFMLYYSLHKRKF